MNKTAEIFYELCAGSTSGHMANVPNNPTMWAVISAYTGSRDSCYACDKQKFADMLREFADSLDVDSEF